MGNARTLKKAADSDAYPNLSKTEALKSIREKTGLPKNMPREEINVIYSLLFKAKLSIEKSPISNSR